MNSEGRVQPAALVVPRVLSLCPSVPPVVRPFLIPQSLQAALPRETADGYCLTPLMYDVYS